MNFPLAVFIISLLSMTYGQKLHEYMTNDELQFVLNSRREDVDNLDYEVVPIFHERLQYVDRNNPRIYFEAHNKNYTLYLEKNNHVLLGSNTPIFLAERPTPNSPIVYSQLKYPFPDYYQLYHDMTNRAAVSLHTDDDNQVHVHGVIGDNLIIRPLTPRIHQDVLRRYPENFPSPDYAHFSFNNNDYDFGFRMPYEATHHVVIRTPRSYFPFDNPINPLQTINSDNPFQTSNQPMNNFNQYNTEWNGKFNRPNHFSFDWSPKIQPFNYNSNQDSIGINSNWNIPSFESFSWPPAPILPPTFTTPQFTTWNFPIQQEFPWNPINQFIGPPATMAQFPSYASRPPPMWSETVLSPSSDWQPITTNRPNNWQSTATSTPDNWQPTTISRPNVWQPTITSRPIDLEPITSKPDTQAPMVTTTEPSETKTEEIFYPEILVVVDHDTYKFHGGDVNQIATYMAAFWNAVDLRYRELHNPKIRLNIAGLIIPKEVGAVPFMEKHLNENKMLLAKESLFAIGEYFHNDTFFHKDKYDIVVAMSHGALASSDNNNTLGMAFVEGACSHGNATAAALITDDGGFSGIITAVHEIGHTLGAPHDEENHFTPERPCDQDDGYLMSYVLDINKDSDNGMHWSRCSKVAIHKFLNSKEAQCLRNPPNIGFPYPKELPGRLLSRDEQCRRSMNLPAYKEEEHNCDVLYCIDQIIKVTQFKPPAEGSYCGEGKICLDADCVNDPEIKG